MRKKTTIHNSAMLIAFAFAALSPGCDHVIDPILPPPQDNADGLQNNNPGCPEGAACPTECLDGDVLEIYYQDDDQDGFGADTGVTRCSPGDGYTTTRGGDCDDRDFNVNPAAAEICDGLNNDCDDAVDEAVGDLGEMCDAVTGAIPIRCEAGVCAYSCVTDAADLDADLARGTLGTGCECIGTEELCDGVDNDCDRVIDEGFALRIFGKDADQDDFGDPQTSVMACQAPPNFVDNIDDCNDLDPRQSPDALELCDGVDNDCDDDVDEDDEDEENCQGECQDERSTLLSECDAPENSVPKECERGVCQFECSEGWEDENDDLEAQGGDGCELRCEGGQCE